uniref:BRICHOS domain containing 5 n=1 Tax=Cyprinus carpio TaxID=7962 RepID=A0A8C2E4X2_CYPCA
MDRTSSVQEPNPNSTDHLIHLGWIALQDGTTGCTMATLLAFSSYKSLLERQSSLPQIEQRTVLDTLLSALNKVHQVWVVGNQTEKHTEFLGVLSSSHVEASTLREPLQSLCQQASVYWTRRSDGKSMSVLQYYIIYSLFPEGPGKQRLIYFCIDICFPSNICVSVCFYYLPE